MSTLATLTQQLENLCDEIDDCGGILPDDILERFADVTASHKDKCGAYVAAINTAKHNAAFYSARSEVLKRRSKTLENIEKNIKDRLKYQLTVEPNIAYISKEGDKITLRDSPESLKINLSLGTRSVSKVIDWDSSGFISPEFCDVVTLTTLNAEKVKKHLQAGNKLNWAELKQDKHIRIT